MPTWLLGPLYHPSEEALRTKKDDQEEHREDRGKSPQDGARHGTDRDGGEQDAGRDQPSRDCSIEFPAFAYRFFRNDYQYFPVWPQIDFWIELPCSLVRNR